MPQHVYVMDLFIIEWLSFVLAVITTLLLFPELTYFLIKPKIKSNETIEKIQLISEIKYIKSYSSFPASPMQVINFNYKLNYLVQLISFKKKINGKGQYEHTEQEKFLFCRKQKPKKKGAGFHT